MTPLDRALDAHQSVESAMVAYLIDRRATHRNRAIGAARQIIDALTADGRSAVAPLFPATKAKTDDRIEPLTNPSTSGLMAGKGSL